MTAAKFTGRHLDLKVDGALVGILPQRQIRERMLAIARGDLTPEDTDPKVWFTSEQSLADALSADGHALRKAILNTVHVRKKFGAF